MYGNSSPAGVDVVSLALAHGQQKGNGRSPAAPRRASAVETAGAGRKKSIPAFSKALRCVCASVCVRVGARACV